ncbi:MAG TPA: hypothetical protein VJT84_07525 [Gaiellaceae bacterium]|nr:hypothetical protein [Gaiellaceae bacterium]
MRSATGRGLLTARIALLLAGFAALGFLAAVALAAPPPQQASASPTSTEPNNVKLCHRTGSPTQPWVVIIIRPYQAAPYIRRGDKLPNPDGSCTDSPHPTTTTTTPPTTTAPPVRTQPNQVRLCHQTGSPSQPWVPILVNQPAVASYLLRGDILAWPDGSCPPPPRPATTTPTSTEDAPTPATTATVDEVITQSTTTVETTTTVESTTTTDSTTGEETTTT